jgi:hypothetical protein
VLSDDDVKVILEALFDIRTESGGSAISWRRKTMASKEARRKIRDEVRADQERYDDVTRRMLERIEYYRRKIQDRRESS